MWNRTIVAVALSIICTWQSTAMAYLHPQMGRFMQRDPIEFAMGMSLYQYEQSSSPNSRDSSGLMDLNEAEQIHDLIAVYEAYLTNHPAGTSSETLAVLHSLILQYKLRLSDLATPFRRCQRGIRGDGIIDEIASSFGTHGYVQADEDGSGYAITDTRANIGQKPIVDSPNRGEWVLCHNCYRTGNALKYGPGIGKAGNAATRQEISLCLKNSPMHKKYSAATYNCNNWADDAVEACGLKCP